MKKYFGTDGIRGKVGIFPISVDFILKLGWAVGKVLGSKEDGRVLIGKDTRLSGYMFESALQAGLTAAGVDVYLLGPIPTPAIAYLTRTFRAQAGIVISASHNHYADNGIKFFSTEGAKFIEETEQLIEKTIDEPFCTAMEGSIGRVFRLTDAAGRYVEYCKAQVPHNTNFNGLKVVLDCANGATYSVAPKVFKELGANIMVVNNWPNGTNINENCGSLHPQRLIKTVLQENADVGIAFDGDGDRVIMVDHKGELVDGDQLLFIIAKHRQKRKRFKGGVVGTHMTNMGLELALKELGIPFVRTPVGDHFVLEELLRRKWYLGGEPSGHIMCLDKSTTADGIIAAMQVLRAMHCEGKPLHELKVPMHLMPQIVYNVNCDDREAVLHSKTINSAVHAAEQKLGKHGRVLLRASGTESVIRIMVEGDDDHCIKKIAEELALLVREQACHIS